MSKKSTSSFLENTRFTASPNPHTGVPLCVNLSSGSLVKLPANMTRLKLTMFLSSFCVPCKGNNTGTLSVLKRHGFRLASVVILQMATQGPGVPVHHLRHHGF